MNAGPLRAAVRALAAACALVLLLALPASGGDDDPAAPRCRCAHSEACYHYLNAPVAPPEGPCPCPACTPEHVHDGGAVVQGWNPACWAMRSLDAFLRRHAASWRLTCSACLDDAGRCKFPHPERCPACQDGDAPSPWAKDAAATMAERIEVESRVFRKSAPVIVYSKHFYVVTDIQRIRIATQGSGLRVASGHEYAHIMLVRAEQALRDFRDRIGMCGLSQPMGIFLPASESTAMDLQGAYFRNRRVSMIYSSYGSQSQSAIAGGFCLNGLCVSAQKFADDDRAMHQAMRHKIGNICFTNWVVQTGDEHATPPWAFEGAGHWLGKLPEFLRDEVNYHEGEDNRVSGSGKGWMRDLAQAAGKGGLRPIDEIVAATTLGRLGYRDFQQCWGWFQVAMEDCPEKWVAVLRDLRRETEVHEAFRKEFGFEPAEFQQRFGLRITGVRKSLLDGPAPSASSPEAAAPAGANASPQQIAAKIRADGRPGDRAAVAALWAAAARSGDLLRETAFGELIRATAPEAREAVWTIGLAHADPMVRAYAARACREMKLAGARDALRKLLDDPSWLVRAESALASAAIRDIDAQARIREMLGDAAPKARIGATDALALLGADANPVCVPLLVANLAHADWQVRVATCQALAVLGDVRAVGPMIDRMPTETARVRREMRLALAAITGDDLGPKSEHWKEWWEKEEARVRERGGFAKNHPSHDDGRYAAEVPKYYGIELWSERLGFLVDTSRSTNRNFTPHPDLADRLLGGAEQGTVESLLKAQAVQTLRALDVRSKFNVWTFGTYVSRWNRTMVGASRANVDAAESFLKSRTPDGETNFYDALRAALDLGDGESYRAGFDDNPDTLTFLTDGTATEGEIIESAVLRRWYAGLARYARVRTHTIAFGVLGVDERLLRGIADDTGGTFVQVDEFRPK